MCDFAEARNQSWSQSHASSFLEANNLLKLIWSQTRFDSFGPVWQAIPEFLATTSYKNPEDALYGPFQLGNKTDLHLFDWLAANPKQLGFFTEYMTAQREGMPSWLDVFPMAQEIKAFNDPERVFLVDVGGGVGHQCVALLNRYHKLLGPVILQDRPEVLANALPINGVEFCKHNFFDPQSVKSKHFLNILQQTTNTNKNPDAKFYYLRVSSSKVRILTDTIEASCVNKTDRMYSMTGQIRDVELFCPISVMPWAMILVSLSMKWCFQSGTPISRP